MKFLIIISFLALSNAHWWQGSDACGYLIGGSHDHVPRNERELDCSRYMQTTVTPSYLASSVVTITAVILNEVTYTEPSTDIVYMTARNIQPRNIVIVTVTGDATTITTTEEAIKTTTTKTIPPYAISACQNHSVYVEACRNHLSVVIATVTITAPTSYVTEYAAASLLGDSSGSSISGLISGNVETINVTSSSLGENSSSSSSSLGLVVEPASTNVTASSFSFSNSVSEILSVPSFKTSNSLGSGTYPSTSLSITSSNVMSFSSSSDSSFGSASFSGPPTSTTPLSSSILATFTTLNSLSKVSIEASSNSLTSATESSLLSSRNPTSEMLIISPSSSSSNVSSTTFLPSTIRDTLDTSSSSMLETPSSLLSTLSSLSSFTLSPPFTSFTIIISVTSSIVASETLSTLKSSFSSSSISSLSSKFSIIVSSSPITSQSSTNTPSSSSSTSLPTSSSFHIPNPPASPLVATCSAPAACSQNQFCSPDNTCLCQPTVNGTGYCMADTPCSALTSCIIDSDCGIGSACMRTCCSNNKCLSLQGLCQNPRTSFAIFKREDEGSSGHRMVGEVKEGGEEEEWTNRGPWVKRLERV